MSDELFDVVIYEVATGKVESIVGSAMRRDGGHYNNAERRLATALGRLNDRYDAAIVPNKKYAKDSIIEDADK